MTLNFSPCSVFPPAQARVVDDDFSPTTMRNWLEWEADEAFGSDRWSSGGSSSGAGSYDPIDLLPSDPFGMDMSSTFTAAIAGWFEDLEDDLAARLGLLWNSALFSSSETQRTSSGGAVQEVMECSRAREAQPCGAGGAPHEGLFFALGYLGVRDLLSVEMVCKSLRSAVRNDTLLWKCVHIDSQLSGRITDETLLRLMQRAQGSLQCLSLAGCGNITDDGLKRVLDGNMKLKKLSIPGCNKLSIDGLINNLKAFMSLGAPGVQQLKLGRGFIVTEGHYEELKLLLSLDQRQDTKACNPRFYHNNFPLLPCDDECAIDIEVCPGCQKLKIVYDCPMESCEGKEGPEQCRACDLCIPRCVQCGRCIKNCMYIETFWLENLCSSCHKRREVLQLGYFCPSAEISTI